MVWRATPRSKSILMAGYDARRRVMTVVYTGGTAYDYQDVPSSLWEQYENEIDNGGSAGAFINNEVKPYFRFDKEE
ncbi:KTSC domain-containing protein [Chitinophaga costaii]|uniref:KTSC domain-containing protein n=1 Tax=Chitinophaga costaii TaxID=1335309 RepID=A0A1C4C8Y9_9BACT|nr:KTSC domain-containing protein [Chitinophaga costaii]SCC15561.1 KTSC domain-containing protein [Chitinophaga costaii]